MIPFNLTQPLYIEETIINAVRSLLAGRVNQLLADIPYGVPAIEFGDTWGGGYCSNPAISLSTCECTRKERLVRLDAYTLTVTFDLPPGDEGERNSYAYASTVEWALAENPALGGVVNRAVLAGKKYFPPKAPACGEGWRVVLVLRITVENLGGSL